MIRVEVPDGWLAGDKTARGTVTACVTTPGWSGPVGIPAASPVVLTVLTDEAGPDDEPGDDLIARTMRIVVAEFP